MSHEIKNELNERMLHEMKLARTLSLVSLVSCYGIR